MNHVEEKIRDMPLRKWPCTGCRFLERRSRDPEVKGYRCAYFDYNPVPFMARLDMRYADLTPKRIHGPHTDEDVPNCPAFEDRKNHD